MSAAVLLNGVKQRLVSGVRTLARAAMPGDKFNVVFVLGGPGAGKGTQCARIVSVRTGAVERLILPLLECVGRL